MLRRKANLGTIDWSAVFSVKDFLGAILTQEFENDLLFIHTHTRKEILKSTHTYTFEQSYKEDIAVLLMRRT